MTGATIHPRRAEYHIGAGRRAYRVLIYSDVDAECGCPDGTRPASCAHVRHARRLLTEPARVALEHVIATYAAIPLTERTEWAHAMYRTAAQALAEDDRRVTHSLNALDRALDTRTPEERDVEAAALFDNTGQHGKGYSREDRRRIARMDEADLLTQLRDAGPDTTIIRRSA